MKALRLLRNIAVLFILVMVWPALHPKVSRAKTDGYICVQPGKTGFNCSFDSIGECFETKCEAGQACEDASCEPAPDFDCKKNPYCF